MSSAVPALAATGVSKSFGATQALSDVDLSIAAGEIHALIGENGSGKSTFIKILAGYHAADEGTVIVGGDELKPGDADASYTHGCRFVHQNLALVDGLSVLDNLSLGSGFPTSLGTIRRRTARQEVEQALAAVDLDIDPDMLVDDLSPAARTAVAVARALRKDAAHPPRLLVLDEPTATMPDDEVHRLHRAVRHVAAAGMGVLYVSHRIEEVLELCDTATVLRDGVHVADGTLTGMTRTDLVDHLVGAGHDSVVAAHERLRERRGALAGDVPPVLDVRALVCENVAGMDLAVRAGEIVGIAGITGSGRETALAAIFGATARESGEVHVRGRQVPSARPRASIAADMAYVPPDRAASATLPQLSARENLTILDLAPFWRRLGLKRSIERRETDRWFAGLSIRPAHGAETPIAAFSGGNQQKIIFARWLRARPSVLLLDEPTQGVDIGAKAVLHQRVVEAAEEGAAVVVASTDVEELAALCDRVIVMRDGRPATELTHRDVSALSITRACLEHSQEAVA